MTPSAKGDGERCPACGGSGTIQLGGGYVDAHDHCHGTGRIPSPAGKEEPRYVTMKVTRTVRPEIELPDEDPPPPAVEASGEREPVTHIAAANSDALTTWLRFVAIASIGSAKPEMLATAQELLAHLATQQAELDAVWELSENRLVCIHEVERRAEKAEAERDELRELRDHYEVRAKEYYDDASRFSAQLERAEADNADLMRTIAQNQGVHREEKAHVQARAEKAEAELARVRGLARACLLTRAAECYEGDDQCRECGGFDEHFPNCPQHLEALAKLDADR